MNHTAPTSSNAGSTRRAHIVLLIARISAGAASGATGALITWLLSR